MFEAAQSGDSQFAKSRVGGPRAAGRDHPMRSKYHDQNWSSISVCQDFLVAHSQQHPLFRRDSGRRGPDAPLAVWRRLKKISMIPAKEVPAAHGTVAVKTGRNGNTDVNITTKSLAQPSALTPPAETYVVWFQPPDQSPKNMGALRVDNDLNGKLDTVAPYRHFKVFITAEKQQGVASPHGPQVLTAEVIG